MVVFDTNIFIYVGSGQLDRAAVDGVDACYASITSIEVLGFHKITVAEYRRLAQILGAYQPVDLSGPIIQRAITLRQAKKMTLGDAIIAATALECDCELWTANIADFAAIDGLKVYNPLEALS